MFTRRNGHGREIHDYEIVLLLGVLDVVGDTNFKTKHSFWASCLYMTLVEYSSWWVLQAKVQYSLALALAQ